MLLARLSAASDVAKEDDSIGGAEEQSPGLQSLDDCFDGAVIAPLQLEGRDCDDEVAIDDEDDIADDNADNGTDPDDNKDDVEALM